MQERKRVRRHCKLQLVAAVIRPAPWRRLLRFYRGRGPAPLSAWPEGPERRRRSPPPPDGSTGGV